MFDKLKAVELRSPGRNREAEALIREHIARHRRTLEPADCRFTFPALGIPVEHFNGIIGRRLRNRVPRGVPIRWSDLDPA